jgi:hypothetical protein
VLRRDEDVNGRFLGFLHRLRRSLYRMMKWIENALCQSILLSAMAAEISSGRYVQELWNYHPSAQAFHKYLVQNPGRSLVVANYSSARNTHQIW